MSVAPESKVEKALNDDILENAHEGRVTKTELIKMGLSLAAATQRVHSVPWKTPLLDRARGEFELGRQQLRVSKHKTQLDVYEALYERRQQVYGQDPDRVDCVYVGRASSFSTRVLSFCMPQETCLKKFCFDVDETLESIQEHLQQNPKDPNLVKTVPNPAYPLDPRLMTKYLPESVVYFFQEYDALSAEAAYLLKSEQNASSLGIFQRLIFPILLDNLPGAEFAKGVFRRLPSFVQRSLTSVGEFVARLFDNPFWVVLGTALMTVSRVVLCLYLGGVKLTTEMLKQIGSGVRVLFKDQYLINILWDGIEAAVICFITAGFSVSCGAQVGKFLIAHSRAAVGWTWEMAKFVVGSFGQLFSPDFFQRVTEAATAVKRGLEDFVFGTSPEVELSRFFQDNTGLTRLATATNSAVFWTGFLLLATAGGLAVVTLGRPFLKLVISLLKMSGVGTMHGIAIEKAMNSILDAMPPKLKTKSTVYQVYWFFRQMMTATFGLQAVWFALTEFVEWVSVVVPCVLEKWFPPDIAQTGGPIKPCSCINVQSFTKAVETEKTGNVVDRTIKKTEQVVKAGVQTGAGAVQSVLSKIESGIDAAAGAVQSGAATVKSGAQTAWRGLGKVHGFFTGCDPRLKKRLTEVGVCEFTDQTGTKYSVRVNMYTWVKTPVTRELWQPVGFPEGCPFSTTKSFAAVSAKDLESVRPRCVFPKGKYKLLFIRLDLLPPELFSSLADIPEQP